jgi:alpha-galactosidase
LPKITFIGAGSTVFAKNLMGDILSFPELAEAHISLMDIDADRLRTSASVARKVAAATGANPTITTHTDRREALEGADYAINMIQVGGYKPATVIDFEIPKKYGLRQTIADTLGIGGIMRALRTIPVMLGMVKDMEEVSADGITFLNYVNPMAMNTWAVTRTSRIPVVGLCHSVQGTAEQIARDIGVPINEINYLCAGINHMAFYTRFERNGVDLYPLIRQVVKDGRVPDWNRVRYEMLTRLGYFVTESSEHFAEYCPYFIKSGHPELIEQFNVPLDEYIRRCENQLAGWHKMREEFEGDAPIEVHRSHEYGSLIIHSLVTGQPRVVYGNVANNGLINNLPQGCCVEVPVLVDKSGLQPTHIGSLPPQLAAIMQTNINVQSLTVEAALTGIREHVYHAAMFDPHTAAELTLEQIHSMVDELLAAHGDYIPALH